MGKKEGRRKVEWDRGGMERKRGNEGKRKEVMRKRGRLRRREEGGGEQR